MIANDIFNLMDKYNKKCNMRGAECLIKRMDMNRDGKTDYSDFLEFIGIYGKGERCLTMSTHEDNE